MPFSKNLAKYPKEFLLIPALKDEELPFAIAANNEKAAHTLRMKIYGFTEALRNAKHPDSPRMDSLLIRVQGPLVIVELRDLQYAEVLKDLKQTVEASEKRMSAPKIKPTEPYESHSEDYIEKTYGNRETPLLSQPCGGIFVHGPFNDKCYRCGHPMLAHPASEASSPNIPDIAKNEEK